VHTQNLISPGRPLRLSRVHALQLPRMSLSLAHRHISSHAHRPALPHHRRPARMHPLRAPAVAAKQASGLHRSPRACSDRHHDDHTQPPSPTSQAHVLRRPRRGRGWASGPHAAMLCTWEWPLSPGMRTLAATAGVSGDRLETARASQPGGRGRRVRGCARRSSDHHT